MKNKRTYKRKSEHDYGDYNRHRKLRTYGTAKGHNTYTSDDIHVVPIVNKSRERRKNKVTDWES